MAEKQFGADLGDWTPPPRPGDTPFEGRFVRLERLEADGHAADLHRAFSVDDGVWDYLGYGPFGSASRYHRWVKDQEASTDPVFYALRDQASGHLGGVASLLRIAPEAGSIEVGHICISPEMQRKPAVTEMIYLLMNWAFEEGYRRFEWKCDALNKPSRRAAQRYGFSYEGIFRQHMVYKGRNRDTAWFSVIDSEWAGLREAYQAWLSPANFDGEGQQRERLGDLTGLVRTDYDPEQ